MRSGRRRRRSAQPAPRLPPGRTRRTHGVPRKHDHGHVRNVLGRGAGDHRSRSRGGSSTPPAASTRAFRLGGDAGSKGTTDRTGRSRAASRGTTRAPASCGRARRSARVGGPAATAMDSAASSATSQAWGTDARAVSGRRLSSPWGQPGAAPVRHTHRNRQTDAADSFEASFHRLGKDTASDEARGAGTRRERDVKFIRLWFTDILGQLKSFAITPGAARLGARPRNGLRRLVDHRVQTTRSKSPT